MKYAALIVFSAAALAQSALPNLGPLLHAHNCYPYEGKWPDRIDRALNAAPRVVIEQDLAWANGRLVVSHETETMGAEPTLEEHFFNRVRPMMERALQEGARDKWPVVILHLDFKENSDRVHRALWDLLGEYESWITTAPKLTDPATVAPLDTKPLLVLTEDNDLQEQHFFRDVPVGARLRLFGSARRVEAEHPAALSPGQLLPAPPDNYRRWWNNSWAVVEEGGQAKAGAWTAADATRLRALVDHAHKLGYWIRFYTINGHPTDDEHGWSAGYNFGSFEGAQVRWRAAIDAGVDLIATDQYEDLGRLLVKPSR